MSNISEISSVKWLIIGVVPILLLVGSYIGLDFYMTDSTRDTRATLFIVFAGVFLTISVVATFKVSGIKRFLPIFGIGIAIMLILWLLFVLSFTVTF